MLSKFLFVEKQKVKNYPILVWVNTEFGLKPVVYTTFFGGKQEGITKAVQAVLMKTTDCELASIDAMAAAAHSLVIPLAIFRGRRGIDEAIELIRLEEDHQVCVLHPLLFSSASSNLLPLHLAYAC
jgi:ATP synthase mitochondrial F1 complex assembly factor 2